jgi:hypothetical protein
MLENLNATLCFLMQSGKILYFVENTKMYVKVWQTVYIDIDIHTRNFSVAVILFMQEETSQIGSDQWKGQGIHQPGHSLMLENKEVLGCTWHIHGLTTK